MSFALIIALLSALLFGVSTPINKILLNEVNYFQLAGLLYLGAAIGLIPFVFRKSFVNTIRNLDRKNTGMVMGTIIFGGILGPVFLLLGLKSAYASSVSIWLNLELIATAVLGVLIFKDNLNLMGWLGVIGAVIAGIIITINEGIAGVIPAIFIALACISWGLDNHFTALIDRLKPTEITFLKGIVSGSFNFSIGLIFFGGLPQLRSISYAILLGIFSYGVSIVFYIIAAHRLGATRSQIVFSSAPFFGLLFSYILLSENPTLLQGIGALIMIISILLINRIEHTHYHYHPSMEHVHLHSHNELHHDHEHEGDVIFDIHIHSHRHEEEKHKHPHYPDIHHRHDHNEDE